jgi:hypothetical protein
VRVAHLKKRFSQEVAMRKFVSGAALISTLGAVSAGWAYIQPTGPATLSGVTITFHVRDDDKDRDSSEGVTVTCSGHLAADAYGLGTEIVWHDQTDVGPMPLNNIDRNIEPSDCGKIHVDINHSTHGNDNFKFGFTVTLSFSDGSRATYDHSSTEELTKDSGHGAWDVNKN